MKYRDIEVGEQCRWKRPFGGQVDRLVKTVSTAGVPFVAASNWRDHVPDGLITVTKKSRWGVIATTADGRVTSVNPQHLSPADEDTEQ